MSIQVGSLVKINNLAPPVFQRCVGRVSLICSTGSSFDFLVRIFDPRTGAVMPTYFIWVELEEIVDTCN